MRSRSAKFRGLIALIRPHWRVLLAGVVLVITARVAGLVLPGSTKLLIDDVIGNRNRALLLPLTAAVLAASVLQAAASYLVTVLLTRAGHRLVTDLRVRVQRHMGQLPLSWFDRRRTGALTTNIMGDVEHVRFLVGAGVIDFLGGLVSAGLGMAVLLSISPTLTAFAVISLLVFGFLTRREVRRFRPLLRERQRINAEIAGRLNESLGGIRVVKAYAAESREAGVFAAGCRRLLHVQLRTAASQAIMSFSAALTMGCVGAAVMCAGTNLILDGALTLGGLLTFTVFLAMVVSPGMQLASVAGQLTEALAALDRCYEILRLTPEHVDARRTRTLSRWHGDIEFDNVSFAYGDGPLVLRDISFRAAPGTVTALVGPSGAGKSTITSLVAAFYQATQGRVLAGGIDLSVIELGFWRSQLGVVLQETFLFDGSIFENVAFSRPDASRAEVLRACRMAHVDEFAERFPEGYDTIVGERGVRLSGGQKQRISITRAILSDPKILILDEATSSLDSESEALIQEALRCLIRGRTTFVIAHRLSTIRSADQILVLEDGQIVERGSHDALYLRRGRYFELCSRQELAGMQTVLC